jgi:hypothetical protein
MPYYLTPILSHYLITHQAFAQELWIRNTPRGRHPWKLTSLNYPFIPEPHIPVKGNLPKFRIFSIFVSKTEKNTPQRAFWPILGADS